MNKFAVAALLGVGIMAGGCETTSQEVRQGTQSEAADATRAADIQQWFMASTRSMAEVEARFGKPSEVLYTDGMTDWMYTFTDSSALTQTDSKGKRIGDRILKRSIPFGDILMGDDSDMSSEDSTYTILQIYFNSDGFVRDYLVSAS